MAGDRVTIDDERFEELFDAHYRDVLAYAVRRCRSVQDAEDVVAETFAAAWRRLADVPPGDEARLWLFGTARLVRMNHHRSDSRRRNLLQRIQESLPPQWRRGPDSDVGESHRIRRALEALTDTDREVLQLHVWEDLSAHEIASALEISTAAVWKRLQRARERLADALEEEDGEPGTRIASIAHLGGEAVR